MSGTGENEQGLKQILDFTRMCAFVVLLCHYYTYCYSIFTHWGLRSAVVDRVMENLAKTGLLNPVLHPKLAALALLMIALVGARGRKDENLRISGIAGLLAFGLGLYFFSPVLLHLFGITGSGEEIYMVMTTLGFLLVLAGGTRASRYLRLNWQGDVFNEQNETFPQEERLLENEYSVNLPAHYFLRGQRRRSWINIINPFRGLLVTGTPGSGKSYFVIQHLIQQHIRKGFSMLVYDFKYDDLTRIAYNTLLLSREAYPCEPRFCLIHFDDPCRTHRCNPLHPQSMRDITDAMESARSILLGLNREWISRQGDFFVESPINFLTAVIWFLKKYRDGIYCTLPHVIELMQTEYEKLFPVLQTEKEIEVLINPFISAYQNRAAEQLEGQIASAKIGMARLSSPQLYWVLNGNDCTLDINNPGEPKVLCLANNPQKQQVFGAVLSLYVNRVVKEVNRKGRWKCSLVFDEFPTVFINGMDNLLATARSNKVATCLGLQDFSQLKKDYGSAASAVITQIVGNIISGQVTGETARTVSERIGRIVQVKESVSLSRDDTSYSRSGQLDLAVPASKMAGLSSGEFAGMVADDSMQKIKRKAFHAVLENNEVKLQRQQEAFRELPVVQQVTEAMIRENYLTIKNEVEQLVDREIDRLLHVPGRSNGVPC